MTHLTRGAFALTVLCVLPIAAGAQQSTATSPAQYVVNNQTADRLLEQAVALEGEHSQRGDAAKLYARSADLRSYGDVRAHQAYQRAGWLLVGENPRSAEKARQMFVKAGNRALETGHVYEAAVAFTDAAQLVANHGARPLNEGLGRQHFEMALRLSDSPLLTEQQRTMIKDRLRA
jgi:hypothetical protein